MYRPPLSSSDRWKELSERWIEATDIARMAFNEENAYISATSKVLWFYHPEHWIMYDQLNVSGLKQWAKHSEPQLKRIKTPEGFSEAFW